MSAHDVAAEAGAVTKWQWNVAVSSNLRYVFITFFRVNGRLVSRNEVYVIYGVRCNVGYGVRVIFQLKCRLFFGLCEIYFNNSVSNQLERCKFHNDPTSQNRGQCNETANVYLRALRDPNLTIVGPARRSNDPKQRQILHDTLELDEPHIPNRQHRQRDRREPKQFEIRLRPSQSHLPRLHAGHEKRGRNGKIHHIQRFERRIRDVPNNEPKPPYNRRLRQTVQTDVFHDHVQTVHAPTGGAGVPPRPRLLLYIDFDVGRLTSENRRPMYDAQHEDGV